MSTNPSEASASSMKTTHTVLESCLVETNSTYQTLLGKPGSLDQCKEAGKTVRRLAQCLADLELVTDDSEDGEDSFSDVLNDG